MKFLRPVVSLFASLALAACTTGAPPPQSAASSAGKPSTAGQIFVVASNPLAVEAGMAVLRRGGSAVDGAIAVQAMLSLVEPQSSGMGGGAFMTFFDGASGKVVVYDGRETAPAGADSGLFLGADGKPLPFGQAVVGGRATGVPATGGGPAVAPISAAREATQAGSIIPFTGTLTKAGSPT